MKTHLPETLQAPGGPVRKDRRGVALITVLTFVALTTILMMTFFFMAQNEHMASVNYSEGLQAQEVAESAVNLVIAQIREATSQRNHLWAAQPGAIRLWDDSGKFVKGYKLYSDDRMVSTVSERDFSREDFAEMSTWTAQPWAYVDLNEPVIRGSKVFYPIVDPEAADLPKWPALIGGTGRKGDDAGVEGFDYDRNHDRVRLSDFDKEVQSLTGKDVLPMPAKWIYQLKDGSLGYLNTGNKYVSLSSGGSIPSESNPMVARFAFWADDESAKLNINTHAGGASWNTPLTGGDVDRNYGAKQPLKGEYQRYNGHPASTHLSPALMPGVADITNDRQALEMMFDITPRVVGGGSLFGTKAIDPTGGVDRSLKPDHDRLYATIDELLFKDFSAATGKRELNIFPQGGGRVGTAKPLPEKDALELLERMRFFLTTNSRAPETNAFNMPRVSVWPTFDKQNVDEVSYLTGFDKLIRFCSEMGVDSGDTRHAYYFTRRNSDSARDDFNEIKRNRDVFAYLDYLTSENVPGYGGNFASKYDGTASGNRIQLLTEIFDYIRSTNLSDDSLYMSGTFDLSFKPVNTTETVQYTNPRLKGKDGGLHPGFGQVTPIQIDWTDRKYGNVVAAKGFGRFFTLSDVGVAVITCAQAESEGADEAPSAANKLITKRFPGGLYAEYTDPGAWDGEFVKYTEPPLPVDKQNDFGKKAYFSNFPPLPLNVNVWVREIARDANNEPIMGFLTRPPGDPGATWAEAAHVNAYTWPEWIFDLLSKYGTRSRTADAWGAAADRYPFTDEMFNKYVIPKPPDGPAGDENWIVAPKELLWAFDEKNWNWMLAWLDNNYRNGMWSDPEGTIYQRSKISADLIAAQNMRLKDGETLCQAIMLFQMAGQSPGNVPISPDFEMDIEIQNGLTFTGGGDFIGPGNDRLFEYRGIGGTGGNVGADLGYAYFFERPATNAKGGPTNLTGQEYSLTTGNGLFQLPGLDVSARYHGSKRRARFDTGYRETKTRACDKYDFVTAPFKLPPPAGNFSATQQLVEMTAGTVNFKIYTAGNDEWPQGDVRDSKGNYGSAPKSPKQLVQDITVDLPAFKIEVPKLSPGFPGDKLDGQTQRTASGLPPPTRWSASFDGANPKIARLGRLAMAHGAFFDWHRDVAGTKTRGVGIAHGDLRLAAARRVITPADKLFAPSADYDDKVQPWGMFGLRTGYPERNIVANANYGNNHPRWNYKYKSREVQLYGDFDNGPGIVRDGAYINKADEGNLHYVFTAPGGSDGGIPYFSATGVSDATTPSYFSPNRIICSPVMFGSLPTRPFTLGPDGTGSPWQTLLFRPNVAGGLFTSHPGATSPPDHLMLDLFWMPVVEPYAISEPLSTAGKVNLNYQILPYLNIKRTTALRGVFKSEYMVVIPSAWETGYKEGASYGAGWHSIRNPYGGSLTGISLRAHIEPTGTFEQMDKKFDSDGQIYKTASEICDIHLVPISIGSSQGGGRDNGINTPHYNQMANGTYWSVSRVTGDNAKERPYNNIYPRVTTKSNVYKVHYRAQIIRKAGPSPVDSFDPELDQVVAEYRGSSTVERYVEPNDPDIPDYTQIVDDPALPPLDEFYRFRVLNPTRFAP